VDSKFKATWMSKILSADGQTKNRLFNLIRHLDRPVYIFKMTPEPSVEGRFK